MFTILCCADLHGEKVNLEVTLDAAPVSVQELVSHLSAVFGHEEHVLLQPHHHHHHSDTPHAATVFPITTVLIYDDALLRWTKLKSITQLHEYDQLYVFQPQTATHKDTQQDLPPPRPPARSRATSLTGTTPTIAAAYREPSASMHRTAYAAAASGAVPPSVQLRKDDAYGGPRSTPPLQQNSRLSNDPGVASRSPVRAQLEEQRQEEERLSQRLSTVRSERERLEREAQREEEELRRRRTAELDELLKLKEQEIWAHRDALATAEEQFRQLLAEKQRLVGAAAAQ